MPRNESRGGRTSSRQDDRKKPVFDGRAGMVKFAVWENYSEKKDKVFPAVTFSRLYKDGNDRWQSTSSFNVWDLPDLARAAFSAEAYIRQNYGDEDDAGDEGRRDGRAA